MQCSLKHFDDAEKRGQMPKPICANGLFVNPSTICAAYDRGCEPGFHAVCPGVSVDKNGSCV